MDNLTPFTLARDEQKDDWALRNDMTGKTVRRFDTKDDATKGGVLEGRSQEARWLREDSQTQWHVGQERTYPRSKVLATQRANRLPREGMRPFTCGRITTCLLVGARVRCIRRRNSSWTHLLVLH